MSGEATPQDQARRFYAKGIKLIEIGRAEEALHELRRGLMLSPNDARMLTAAAWATRLSGDLDEALRLVEQALAVAPDLEWPHRLRSVILLKLGREAEALDEALEARKLDPEGAYALQQLFSVQRRTKMLSEAWKSAHLLVQVAPEDAESHINLGLIQLDYGRNDYAEKSFRRALEIDPESDTALNNLGVALRRQNKTEEAIHAFYRATRLTPDADLARSNLGKARQSYVSAGQGAIIAMVLVVMLAPFLDSADGISETAKITIFGAAIVAIVGLFLLARLDRIRRLPEAVRHFVDDETRFRRRQTLHVALIVTVVFLMSFSTSAILMIFADQSLLSISRAVVMLALTVLAMRGVWRTRAVRKEG